MPSTTHAYTNSLASPSDPSHLLSPTQRSRLIKSTRKLAKILGTTPLLQVTPPSPSHDPRRARLRPSSRSLHEMADESVATTASLKLRSLDPSRSLHHRKSEDSASSDAGSIRSTASAPASSPNRRQDAPWVQGPPVLQYKPKKRPDFKVDTAAAQRFSTSSQQSAMTVGGRHSRSNSNASTLSAINSPRTGRFLRMSTIMSGSVVLDAEKTKEVAAQARRKRMSKLTRYLGEPVPPALVQPIATQKIWRLRRTRSISVPSAADEFTVVSTGQPQATTVAGPAPLTPSLSIPEVLEPEPADETTTSPSSVATHVSHATLVTLATPPIESVAFAPADIGAVPRRRISHLRSRSEAAPSPRLGSFYERDYFENEDVYSVRSDSQSEEPYYRPDSRADVPRSESRLGVLRNILGRGEREDAGLVAHRSERRQGWSGEWNAASVQDVIVKLRDLK
ncbi:hypothetical protein FA95DRAFT_1554339 [Auriscalpium vulgare]|uniref:Uncharacterized protein n=1 Tax=Auriscalpium vulgare TaxID=40419 RepID=A0ACB8S5L3_9AGAM|nr:hypothetical protein FA95DRAFT_1554339 [Auriscalpium vulgare]